MNMKYLIILLILIFTTSCSIKTGNNYYLIERSMNSPDSLSFIFNYKHKTIDDKFISIFKQLKIEGYYFKRDLLTKQIDKNKESYIHNILLKSKKSNAKILLIFIDEHKNNNWILEYISAKDPGDGDYPPDTPEILSPIQ